MFRFIAILSFVALIIMSPNSLTAQSKGGTIIADGQKIATKPLNPKQIEVMELFSAFRDKVSVNRSAAGSAFFCEGDICGCVGDYDCGKLFVSGLCETKRPGAWLCGSLGSGRLICNCLRDFSVAGFENSFEYAPN